jgi:hypothetical protein
LSQSSTLLTLSICPYPIRDAYYAKIKTLSRYLNTLGEDRAT